MHIFGKDGSHWRSLPEAVEFYPDFGQTEQLGIITEVCKTTEAWHPNGYQAIVCQEVAMGKETYRFYFAERAPHGDEKRWLPVERVDQ